MTTNGLDAVADQLKAAADQYGAEAAELEQQAKTLRDKQARICAAVAAMQERAAPVAKTGRTRRSFVEREDIYLREHWGTMRPAAIARHLDRAQRTISDRAKRLGLTAA